MRKILLLCAVALTFFGCGGDYGNLPPLDEEEYYGSYNSKGNNIYNYRTVTIGTQVWMAENLDYDVTGTKCYNISYCTTYGRLYDWATAMALPSGCNDNDCSDAIQAKHQGICPNGWHIPNHDEWETLSNYVETAQGCSDCDAKHLKARNGWNSNGEWGSVNNGNGLDTYGFAALPGGSSYSGSLSYDDVGEDAHWWSTTNDDGSDGYSWNMVYNLEYYYYYNYIGKSWLFSVRCVQD